jgi:histidyl-tRNA synthetase
MLDMLCDECSDHFKHLQGYLAAAGLTYAVDSRIVRGLDYYTKTVFELITKTPQGNLTVCGGGRYDKLVEELGGPEMPGVGFGMGMERLLMLLDSQGIELDHSRQLDVFVAALGEEARLPAFKLVQELRQARVKADCDHMNKSLNAQFKYANKLEVPFTAILGGDELEKGVVKLRNMNSRDEQELPLDGAAEAIAKVLQG